MLNLSQYLPFLIPVAVLELGLEIAALVHILRRRRTRNLNFVAWLLIILLFNIIGPVCYFFIGRAEDAD